MSMDLEVDDLRLVCAIRRHRSIGAAAREMMVGQPSASHRLAALERKVGLSLFERDTTGARITDAGVAFADEAAHILGHLDALPERAAAAAQAKSISVGCIASLAGMVFSALDAVLPDLVVHPKVDHGPLTSASVADGSLDAAVLTIADQAPLPRGLDVIELLRSPLVTVRPPGVTREAWRPGETVVYSSIDLAGPVVHRRIADRGAVPRLGATAEAAMRIGRQRGCPVVVPEFVARWYGARDEQLATAPVRRSARVSLVMKPPGVPVLREQMGALARLLAGDQG